jgi:hypothetical protein
LTLRSLPDLRVLGVSSVSHRPGLEGSDAFEFGGLPPGEYVLRIALDVEGELYVDRPVDLTHGDVDLGRRRRKFFTFDAPRERIEPVRLSFEDFVEAR